MSDQSKGVADEAYRIECQRKYVADEAYKIECQRKYMRDILKSQQGPRKKKEKEIRLKSDKVEIKNAPTPHKREAQTELE